MKIFWSVFFTVFFRLPIYESIAAIFWQSASYVLFKHRLLAQLKFRAKNVVSKLFGFSLVFVLA